MVTIDQTEKGGYFFSMHSIAVCIVINSWILRSSRGQWHTKKANTNPIHTAARLSSKMRRLSLQFWTWRSCSLELEVVAAAAAMSTAVAVADSVESTAGRDSDCPPVAGSLIATVASKETARISALLLLTWKVSVALTLLQFSQRPHLQAAFSGSTWGSAGWRWVRCQVPLILWRTLFSHIKSFISVVSFFGTPSIRLYKSRSNQTHQRTTRGGGSGWWYGWSAIGQNVGHRSPTCPGKQEVMRLICCN